MEKQLIETTLQIEGMACAMCESHVQDLIHRNFDVRKVKADHRKGTVVITSRQPLSQQKLQESLSSIGYPLLSLSSRPVPSKHFLFF
ncbi:MAG: heavy-metal-associated domain-containing protein [Bulleidia sp.]